MWTNCRLKIAYCYRLRIWIFDQTLYTDVEQNLTICTPLLTGHDAGIETALPATHKALPRRYWRRHLEREDVEWAKYKNKVATHETIVTQN